METELWLASHFRCQSFLRATSHGDWLSHVFLKQWPFSVFLIDLYLRHCRWRAALMRGKISLLVSCQLWERNKFVALRTLARTRVIASENYLPSTVSSLTKCIGDPCCVCRQSFEVKSIENEPQYFESHVWILWLPYFSTEFLLSVFGRRWDWVYAGIFLDM